VLLAEAHLFLDRRLLDPGLDPHAAALDLALADAQLLLDHRDGDLLARLDRPAPHAG
jgi:hypothetical protein